MFLNLWQEFTKTWKQAGKGVSWVVGSVRNAKFRTEKWVRGLSPLIHYASRLINVDELNKCVADFIKPSSE